MPTRPLAVSLCLLALACGAGSSGAGRGAVSMDTAAMIAAVRAGADGFSAAVRSGNVDSVLAYLTDDVVLLEPGMDVKGRDAFRALLTDLWKIYKVRSFAMNPEAHTFGPDVVTEFGRYRETYADSTGTEQVCDCVYSVIWRKGADGTWRQARIHAGQPIKP